MKKKKQSYSKRKNRSSSQVISQRHDCLFGSKAYLISFANIWPVSVIFGSLKPYLAVSALFNRHLVNFWLCSKPYFDSKCTSDPSFTLHACSEAWEVYPVFCHIWPIFEFFVHIPSPPFLAIWLEFIKVDIFPKNCHFFQNFNACLRAHLALNQGFQIVLVVNHIGCSRKK